MSESYMDRMLRAPVGVRPADIHYKRPEGPQGRPPARSDGAEGRVSEDSQGADAPPAPEENA